MTADTQPGTGTPSVEAVTTAIREAIALGELVPNQRLIEADLGRLYGATRNTARLALTELSAEGLVERIPNRGARVRAVSVREAVEIIEVRAALESLCIRKAAKLITDQQAEELEQMGHEMSHAVAAGALQDYSLINKRLHRRIVEISGQQTAAANIERLRAQSVRHQFRLAMQPARTAVSLPEHLRIIEALCARDAPRAASYMESHMESIAQAIRDSAPPRRTH